jgi:SAM-dependent methyltransferase
MDVARMLPLLQCPRSGGSLAREAGRLVSPAGETYPLVNSKPILVRTILDWHLAPPPESKISRNIGEFAPGDRYAGPDAVILHLGSGDVPSHDPRVISMDVLPCPNVDIVCEAEALPFRDASIDYVESGAVFEHLHDPWAAIAEVKRVLKPGGILRIDTAFMQGYHGFPGHFYNMTPQAVETHLAGDYELLESYVPESSSPLMTVTMAIDRYLGYLTADLQERLLGMRLRDVLDEMRRDLSPGSPLLDGFDEYTSRCLAASFAVVARKPLEDEPRRATLRQAGSAAAEPLRALVREYYTRRLELMQRHHEIGYYHRKAREKHGVSRPIRAAEALPNLLDRCRCDDLLDAEAIRGSLRRFQVAEADLRTIRDEWISLYLAAAP